ncbi:hypothetical protein KDA23_01730 [Candidatus Saccharibacteria bacterium]|nr:hypothetical protein [Candidatus Saccharibacteria bacterium]
MRILPKISLRRGSTVVTGVVAIMALTASAALAGGQCTVPKEVYAPPVTVSEGSVSCAPDGQTVVYQKPFYSVPVVSHVSYTVNDVVVKQQVYTAKWGETYNFDVVQADDWTITNAGDFPQSHTFGAKPSAPKGCAPPTPDCAKPVGNLTANCTNLAGHFRMHIRNKSTATGQAAFHLIAKRGGNVKLNRWFRLGPGGEKTKKFGPFKAGTHVVLKSDGEVLDRATVQRKCTLPPSGERHATTSGRTVAAGKG